MKNKKNLIYVLVFVLAFAFLSVPTSYASSSANIKSKKSSVLIEKSTATLELKVNYPIIGQAAIDKDIKSYITKTISDFGPGEKLNAGKNGLYIDYQLSKYKSDYLSVRFYIYTFTGGAHGAQNVVFKNYNLKTGKIISYADIFNDSYNYLEAFWRNAEPQIIFALKKDGWGNDEQAKSWIREGCRPNADNYANFYLTDAGLVIYFGQYQVAPYAAGTFETPIKWNKFGTNLKAPFVSSNLISPKK